MNFGAPITEIKSFIKTEFAEVDKLTRAAFPFTTAFRISFHENGITKYIL